MARRKEPNLRVQRCKYAPLGSLLFSKAPVIGGDMLAGLQERGCVASGSCRDAMGCDAMGCDAMQCAASLL